MSEQAENVETEEEAQAGPTPEERRAWRAVALQLVRQFPDRYISNFFVGAGIDHRHRVGAAIGHP